jgi:hypothetical protein
VFSVLVLLQIVLFSFIRLSCQYDYDFKAVIITVVSFMYISELSVKLYRIIWNPEIEIMIHHTEISMTGRWNSNSITDNEKKH